MGNAKGKMDAIFPLEPFLMFHFSDYFFEGLYKWLWYSECI